MRPREPEPPQALEITPQEARTKLEERDRAILIDVREPNEFALSRIEGAQLIPMQLVPAELQHIEALADDAALMIICHHGVRSLQVAAWLRERGVENCFSVAGGMDRWSREIDPGVPRY
ncbi:MAG: rhodanese-like domain-containing protein [Bryobacteraceae bacterium]